MTDYNFTKDFFEFQNSVNTNFERNETHYHNSYEIYYLTDGECKYFIDNKIYYLSKGDIALIPTGVIHKANYETKYHSRLLINCSENYIPNSVKNVFYDFHYFTKQEALSVEIENIFCIIEKEYTSPDKFSDDIIKCKISELLILISRHKPTINQSQTTNPIIETAIKFIHKNYAENINLHTTASECFVSVGHLSRIFKKETGFGFNEYLTIYRLKKANLLINDNPKIKISDVALRCGFNDSNYFSKVYKKIYKAPPTFNKRTN